MSSARIIAEKHKTTMIVSAVIVLYHRVPAVIIAVKSLSVRHGLMTVHKVILNGHIVAAPRPEPGCRPPFLSQPRALPHYIILDQHTVASHWQDTVTGYFLQQITANNDITIWIPVRTVAISASRTAPKDAVTGTVDDVAVLDKQFLKFRFFLLSCVGKHDGSTVFVLWSMLHCISSSDVLHSQFSNDKASGRTIIFTFNLQS